MDKLDRLLHLHEILDSHRYPVPEPRLREELSCGRSTLYRCLNDLKHRFGAPICNEPGEGWYYDRSRAFEMPGLWFTAAEIRALAIIRQIIADLEPGLLTEHLRSLPDQVDRLLDRAPVDGRADLARRIRMVSHFRREPDNAIFSEVVAALGTGQRLRLDYKSRSLEERTERAVSPQRLVRYRDNWYLDAWCHWRRALRSFAVDRIRAAQRLAAPAKEVGEASLDEYFTDAYGIFAGQADHTAQLVFSSERARWVAEETWHPAQEARWLGDGRYELRVPYGNPSELIGDILRHGAHCSVIAPESLRHAVREELEAALATYP